ncbi:MAG: ATP-binding protein [Acidobacteriota bacterium]
MHRKLLWTLVLGAMGLLANFLTVTVFGNVELRFCGVFPLIAAIGLGPGWGLGAALLSWLGGFAADGQTQVLAALGGLEAFAVGWWVRRRGWMPLTADLLFWIALGVPVLAAFALYGFGGSTLGAWVWVANQPINGALMAVAAELLLASLGGRLPALHGVEPAVPRPLRRHLVHWLVLAAMLPMLVVGVRYGSRMAEDRARDQALLLQRGADQVAQRLTSRLERYRDSVVASAGVMAGMEDRTAETLGKHLEAVRSTYAYSTMLVADRTGRIIVGAPALSPSGTEWWQGSGDSVAYREYFREPMATGKPYVSDVFRGTGYGSNAIVAVSAPVLGADGRGEMVVEASLAVTSFDPFEDLLTLAGSQLLILDRQGRILHAPASTRMSPLQPTTGSPLAKALASAGGEAFSYLGGVDPRWRDISNGDVEDAEGTTWRVAHAQVPVSGWRVLVRIPEADLNAASEAAWLSTLGGIFCAILLSLGVAAGVARKITGSLEKLVAAARDLDVDGSPPDLPRVGPTAPREIAELVGDFSAMALRLDQSYGELRQSLQQRDALNAELGQVLEDLDQRVRERTRELAKAHRQGAETQEQYRRLLDGLEAVVWEYDLATRSFTFVGRRAEQVLGYSRNRWYENPELWLELLDGRERRRAPKMLARLIDAGGAHEIELPVTVKGGASRWLRCSFRVVAGEDGGPKMLRGVSLDVTAQRRAQEVLLRRRKLESIGTLAGGIAHEFNNLLTAVLGSASLGLLALEERAYGEVREHLDMIEDASLQARDLSNQLLTFASGGLPVRTDRDLGRVLTEALGRLDLKVPIQLGELPHLWPVAVDGRQIGQVIQELARNAEQAVRERPDAGIEATARNEEVDAGGDIPLDPGRYVVFTLADGGEGIEAQNLGKVFDPYFTTKESGRGLGLATCHSIVENHGGHIELESTAGEGTRVTVWLPAIEHRAAAPARDSGSTPPTDPVRVLVMDDEGSLRRVTGLMLRRLGHEVETVADGALAVDAYRRAAEEGRHFDLVLMDLTVPGGMGGAEAIVELRRFDPTVRAVVFSGYSNAPVMARYREHGFVGVMTKPFDLEGLKKAVSEGLAVDLLQGQGIGA